jgi:crotonobetainyl-CoA:carnitine CoA-transferase CaiB-like acyl-CoA transferase
MLRKERTKSRRKAQRARARGGSDTTHLSEVYEASKRKLARAIEANKERCWRKFCATLNRDSWGGCIW